MTREFIVTSVVDNQNIKTIKLEAINSKEFLSELSFRATINFYRNGISVNKNFANTIGAFNFNPSTNIGVCAVYKVDVEVGDEAKVYREHELHFEKKPAYRKASSS